MFSLINIIPLLILLNKKIMGFTVTVMTMVPLAEYFLYDRSLLVIRGMHINT